MTVSIRKLSISEATEELKAAHRSELRRLSDLGFVFLNATDGDPAAAERLFDDSIDLLFEDGALQLWRYRLVISAIREGL
jgi:hypothetical protein